MGKGADKLDFLDQALLQRRADHQYRSLDSVAPSPDKAHIRIGDRELINFSSNDYMGLSSHPKVIERSKEYVDLYGTGSGASRLVTGNLDIHEELEKKLASTFGVEAALLLNSGFQANTSLLGSLTDRHSLILADKLSHNSLLQGALLSRGELQRYEHNDYADLRRLLDQSRDKSYSRVWIVSETVFSMDGDRSDLDELIRLSQEYDALLYSDDAHAIGILGERGLGLNYGRSGIDLSLGTFGKAFGGFGAFAGTSQQMKEYLINFCPGFIYSTALPPAVVGALDAALDLIPTMDAERKLLLERIEVIKTELSSIGYDMGQTDSQIIPVIIGDEDKTLALSQYLEEKGIKASAIRPPTVKAGSSRIRLTVTISHTEQDINQLIQTFKGWQIQ